MGRLTRRSLVSWRAGVFPGRAPRLDPHARTVTVPVLLLSPSAYEGRTVELELTDTAAAHLAGQLTAAVRALHREARP